MDKKYYLVGSSLFFSNYKDYESKDLDLVLLVDNPIGFNSCRSVSYPKLCIFEWRRMTPDEFVYGTLRTKPVMQVGKFLNPDFCKDISFTMDHLKQLEPIFNALDERHLYEKFIFEAYKRKNKMELTDSERDQAYEIYKQYKD